MAGAASAVRRYHRLPHADQHGRHRQSLPAQFTADGIVGWAVAIPTLIGIALGLWIDRTWPSQYSWALMFLIAGVIVGCINAAYWVKRVRSKIIEEDEDDEIQP